jgi:preprotein translocase subunit SecG
VFPAWIVFHVIVCVGLILVVLMQSSKGEGLAGSAFGGGLSSAVFGGRGAASFLSKATTVLAIVFMLNCGGLAYLSSQTRPVTNAQGNQTAPTSESAVTRQAQAEMQRQMQQQQQQKANDSGATLPVQPGQATPPAGGGK